MAKSQKKGNREAKKPKQDKPKAPVATMSSVMSSKGPGSGKPATKS